MISRTHALVIAFFITTLSFPVIYLVKGYVSDPLNLFNRSREVYQDLNKDDRVRAALIARNGSYNSVILGSSMLKRINENILSDSNYKYVNISTSGSTIHERLSYLKSIFSKKKLRSVVFSMDHGLSLHRRDYPVNTDSSNWMYLFDQSTLNDLKIYVEDTYFTCIAATPFFPCNLRRLPAQNSDSRYQDRQVFDQKISGIDGWRSEGGRWRPIKSRARRIINNTPFVKQDSTNYIADLRHLKTLANENRKTDFVLVVPPYSMLYLKLMYTHNDKMFSEYREFVSNIYEIFNGSPNVRLLYLDGHSSTGNLKNYIDMRHYIGEVIDILVSDIKSDVNHLKSNFSLRFTKVEAALENYDDSSFFTNYEEKMD